MTMAPPTMLLVCCNCGWCRGWRSLLLPPPPTPAKDGNKGNSDDTDDHLLDPVLPLLVVDFVGGPDTGVPVMLFFALTVLTGMGLLRSGGVFDVVAFDAGGTGLIHFSRKRMTGNSATIVVCEFGGELGKGR